MKEESIDSYGGKVLKQWSAFVNHKNGRGEGGGQQLRFPSNPLIILGAYDYSPVHIQVLINGNPFTFLVSLSVHKIVDTHWIMIYKALPSIKESYYMELCEPSDFFGNCQQRIS